MKNGVMFLSYTGKPVEKQWPTHNVSGTISDILEVEFLHRDICIIHENNIDKR